MESFEKLYNQALRFLSYRIRSEKEVREYLKLKIKNKKLKIADQDSEILTDKIIKKLKNYNFLNDEEFTKKWIENRNRFKPRSIRLIKLELKRKGISKDIIDKLKLTGDNDKDLEQAKKLAKKRIERYKNLKKQQIYERLGRYLASKGFTWNVIKKSIDEALGKEV